MTNAVPTHIHSSIRYSIEIGVNHLFRPENLLGCPARISHQFCSEAAQTGVDARRATEGPADLLDSTTRSPTECNAVGMLGSAAAVEIWREMRARQGVEKR